MYNHVEERTFISAQQLYNIYFMYYIIFTDIASQAWSLTNGNFDQNRIQIQASLLYTVWKLKVR